MTDTIIIPSRKHGDRVWTCIGSSGRATFKGVPLSLRETPCVTCGSLFTISAPATTVGPGNNGFGVTTCAEHRRCPPSKLAVALKRALASWDTVTRLYRLRPRKAALRRRYMHAWNCGAPDHLRQLVETAVQYPHWTDSTIADLRRQTARLAELAAALKADPWVCQDAKRWVEWARLDIGQPPATVPPRAPLRDCQAPRRCGTKPKPTRRGVLAVGNVPSPIDLRFCT
jgi:hypothetical protein